MSIEKLRPSFTFTEDRIKELQAVVPEAFADGKINWDVLREALGEHLEDENQEHFGLFWPGKREARRLAAMPSKGTLIPQPGQGANEDTTHNIFIEGDNLEVLKLLQKSYAGRIKMIYIDPPYNTGNDFVYPDDYSEPLEAYLKRSGQVDEMGQLLTTNNRASGRFHSNWLNMIYPRLVLGRQLLVEDGIIFVSIDDNEVHNLHAIMNEIFGEENFVADIVVVSNFKGRSDKAHIATAHERLLIFKKPTFLELGFQMSEKQKKEYNLTNVEGERYRLLGLRKRGGPDTRKERPNLYFPIYVDPENGTVSLEKTGSFTIEVFPMKSNGVDGRWRWEKQKIVREIETLIGCIKQNGVWDIFQIDYLFRKGEERKVKPKSIWFGSEISTDSATKEFKKIMGDCGFTNPKAVPLIKAIIQYACKADDIILDYFAGSATTAQAMFETNREFGYSLRFLLVQLPEPTPPESKARQQGYRTISEISRERIKRVSKTMEMNSNSSMQQEDTGFYSYRLQFSNFNDWIPFTGRDISQLELLLTNVETPLMSGWQPENLLTEIMLLQGFPLDSRIHTLPQYSQNRVQEVTSDFCHHHLFVCLDTAIQSDTVTAIQIRPEDVLVCLDSALSDEAKITLADRCNLKVI